MLVWSGTWDMRGEETRMGADRGEGRKSGGSGSSREERMWR